MGFRCSKPDKEGCILSYKGIAVTNCPDGGTRRQGPDTGREEAQAEERRSGDGIAAGIAPGYPWQGKDGALRRLSQTEAEVMCAKHTLWLHGAGGEQADFSGCLLDAMDLSGWNLAHAVFHGTKISNTNLNGADLSGCQFQGAGFQGCECSEVTARGSGFQDAEFVSTALDYSVFEGANLSRARFRDCPLDGCLLKGCCIDGTDFGGEGRDAILSRDWGCEVGLCQGR